MKSDKWKRDGGFRYAQPYLRNLAADYRPRHSGQCSEAERDPESSVKWHIPYCPGSHASARDQLQLIDFVFLFFWFFSFGQAKEKNNIAAH